MTRAVCASPSIFTLAAKTSERDGLLVAAGGASHRMAPAPSTSIATPATTVSPNLHTTSQVVVGFSRDPWTTTTVAPGDGNGHEDNAEDNAEDAGDEGREEEDAGAAASPSLALSTASLSSAPSFSSASSTVGVDDASGGLGPGDTIDLVPVPTAREAAIIDGAGGEEENSIWV